MSIHQFSLFMFLCRIAGAAAYLLIQSALIILFIVSKPVFVSHETKPFYSPALTTCASCQTQVTSEVTFKVGTYTWLMCLVFVLCGWEIHSDSSHNPVLSDGKFDSFPRANSCGSQSRAGSFGSQTALTLLSSHILSWLGNMNAEVFFLFFFWESCTFSVTKAVYLLII